MDGTYVRLIDVQKKRTTKTKNSKPPDKTRQGTKGNRQRGQRIRKELRNRVCVSDINDISMIHDTKYAI